MQRPIDGNGNERLGRLETSVENLHNEFTDIRGTLREIQSALGRSRETNWSVIFAGIAVAGSLYAAAIRPLAQDIERQASEKSVIAAAVITQNDKIAAIKSEVENGLSKAERQLLEYQLTELKKAAK